MKIIEGALAGDFDLFDDCQKPKMKNSSDTSDINKKITGKSAAQE